MDQTITSSPSAYQINNEEFQLFDNFAETNENDFLISNDTIIVANINATTNNNSTNKPTTIIHNKNKTAHELLLELDQEIQNEPSWYHNPKLDFIYEQLSPVSASNTSINLHHINKEESTIQKNTEQLLSEFDNVCSAVGLQLTPPTTPPMSPSVTTTAVSSPVQDLSSDYLTGAPIVYIVTVDNDIATQEITSQDMLIDEVLSEASDDSMELIDELVREHTTNLPEDLSSMIDDSCSVAESQINDNVSVSSRSSDSSFSPRSDDASSFASFMSPRSNDSYDVAGYDDEWTPSVDKKRVLKKSSSRSQTKAAESKREKRGYGRPLQEKKARKKEQNKNAATRYRQKKKEQLKVVLTEEEELLQIYNKLQTKHDDVKREIRYLKQLMKEILIAKGVLQ